MSVIASILAFHILICAHELGHYFAARSVGLRAVRVSIGIGPAIISWLHSGTEYRFALLPLGGYVSFTSQRSGTALNLLKELSRAKRIWVILAGPLSNFLLPVAIYGGLLISGEAVILGMKTVPTTHVAAIGADIHQSHVRVGDLILSINGRSVTSYAEVIDAVSMAKTTVKCWLQDPPTKSTLRIGARPLKHQIYGADIPRDRRCTENHTHLVRPVRCPGFGHELRPSLG